LVCEKKLALLDIVAVLIELDICAVESVAA
jgi:hypothetical protein